MILVGIGEIAISNKPGEIIKTMALGSCVGIVMLSKKKNIVAMAHVALPDSSINHNKRNNIPGYFADQAIPYLLEGLNKYGVSTFDITVKLIGGSNIMDSAGIFNIGKRNVLTIRKLLWKYRLGATVEDVGGNYSRTLWVEVDTGKVFISSPKRCEWEI